MQPVSRVRAPHPKKLLAVLVPAVVALVALPAEGRITDLKITKVESPASAARRLAASASTRR